MGSETEQQAVDEFLGVRHWSKRDTVDWGRDEKSGATYLTESWVQEIAKWWLTGVDNECEDESNALLERTECRCVGQSLYKEGECNLYGGRKVVQVDCSNHSNVSPVPIWTTKHVSSLDLRDRDLRNPAPRARQLFCGLNKAQRAFSGDLACLCAC